LFLDEAPVSTDAADRRTLWGWAALLAGPSLAALCYWGPWPEITSSAITGANIDEHALRAMTAITIWMAFWWMTEAVPSAATALLPLVLLPIFKIQPIADVAKHYAHPLIFLFLGGFLVALAIEESGLHKRVALAIVSFVGDQPRRMVGGFMLASAALSMWMSNTATTLLMLPIGASVLSQLDNAQVDPRERRNFGVTLMLGLAYASSIGGFATLIGTPPNVAFQAIFRQQFPEAAPISFGGWMLCAVPLAATFLFLAWVLMTRILFPLTNRSFLGGQDVLQKEIDKLGPIRQAEWLMASVFLLLAFLWIFREPIPGEPARPARAAVGDQPAEPARPAQAGWGWARALGVAKMEVQGKNGTVQSVDLVDDGVIGIAMGLLCFVLPSGGPDRKPLLTWQSTSRLPWSVLLLFGGGLALADGMNNSGLARILGHQVAGILGELSPLAMMTVIATGMTFFTELTSNLACVQIFVPILARSSVELQLNPLLLMVPATIASSCAFMLPVGTPPNAIVYASGRIQMRDMLWTGVWLNLLGVVLVVTFVSLIPMAPSQTP